MKTYKRNNTFWLDTTIDGKRYRISLETSDWRQAGKRANDKILQITEGKLTRSSVNFARLRFEEAAKRYLASRTLELKRSSLTKEEQSLKKPTQFFEGKKLSEITAE